MIFHNDAVVIVAEFCLDLIDSRDEPRDACVRRDLSQLQQVEKSFRLFAPRMKLRRVITFKRAFGCSPSGLKGLGDALRNCRPMGMAF